MKNYFLAHLAGRTIQSAVTLVLAAALLMVLGSPAAASQKDKKKKNATEPATPVVPQGDEQQIDYLISEMLGAWQIGDIDKLHKDYADDVMVVNGMWAPPIIGWNNYLAAYQQQHARMQQIRMDRINTYIKFIGTFGWACYQWEFSAVVDGQPSAARGQTTLIVEKRNNKWVIVHNHTSLAPTAEPISPARTPQIAQPKADGGSQR
ncbi:MAG TPA: nuclear transport factor 2 family protein [Candidatus Solibacter sp.]|nr:nuclear transport factor 2 family protein [Candidatus Solibacter sp.]